MFFAETELEVAVINKAKPEKLLPGDLLGTPVIIKLSSSAQGLALNAVEFPSVAWPSMILLRISIQGRAKLFKSWHRL